jgi:hypothetical protein
LFLLAGITLETSEGWARITNARSNVANVGQQFAFISSTPLGRERDQQAGKVGSVDLRTNLKPLAPGFTDNQFRSLGLFCQAGFFYEI